MNILEQCVAEALRLSPKAAQKLEGIIQRNIQVARLELIRVGVSELLANSNHPLIEDAIVTFCLYKMDHEAMQEKHWSAFEYQEDVLRKSTIGIDCANNGEIDAK